MSENRTAYLKQASQHLEVGIKRLKKFSEPAEEGRWVTMRGRKVFIREGDTPREALDRSLKGEQIRKEEGWLPGVKEHFDNFEDIVTTEDRRSGDVQVRGLTSWHRGQMRAHARQIQERFLPALQKRITAHINQMQKRRREDGAYTLSEVKMINQIYRIK